MLHLLLVLLIIVILFLVFYCYNYDNYVIIKIILSIIKIITATLTLPLFPPTPKISGEDDLLVLGLSDGALNVFLLHTSPKDPREKLSLVQVERPHESPVAIIATTLKKTGADEKENERGGSSGGTPLLVTAGEDSRLFLFRLVRAGKVTKLEAIGYYQLLDIPERIKIKSVSESDGVIIIIISDIIICVTICRSSGSDSDISDSSSTYCSSSNSKQWRIRYIPSYFKRHFISILEQTVELAC